MGYFLQCVNDLNMFCTVQKKQNGNGNQAKKVPYLRHLFCCKDKVCSLYNRSVRPQRRSGCSLSPRQAPKSLAAVPALDYDPTFFRLRLDFIWLFIQLQGDREAVVKSQEGASDHTPHRVYTACASKKQPQTQTHFM